MSVRQCIFALGAATIALVPGPVAGADITHNIQFKPATEITGAALLAPAKLAQSRVDLRIIGAGENADPALADADIKEQLRVRFSQRRKPGWLSHMRYVA